MVLHSTTPALDQHAKQKSHHGQLIVQAMYSAQNRSILENMFSVLL